jgi:hypothetical protein
MYFFLLIICIFTQCVRHSPLIPKDRLFDGKVREIYKNLTYDVYGRPVFEEKTGKHPDKKNDQYCIVDLDDNTRLPQRTFILYNGDCSDCKPDTKKPFNVIYTWTGKGFEIGCDIAEEILKAGSGSDPRGVFIVLGLAGISVATGTTGGFTVGFIKSTDVFIDESKKISMEYEEFFLSYIRYFYDGQKRLIKMIHYTPAEQPVELLITDYYYTGNDITPFKTTVYSVPEKRTREILHKRKTGKK